MVGLIHNLLFASFSIVGTEISDNAFPNNVIDALTIPKNLKKQILMF
jgi:hypothetical protein